MMSFRLTTLLFSWYRRYPVSTHRQALPDPFCKTAIKCDSDLLTLKCLDIKSPIGQHSCEGGLRWLRWYRLNQDIGIHIFHHFIC
ncbi:hypothetical protein CEXT_104661 [Caerostris extrusa]|uniref:Uncharacterized protein n=1 Tax=Caerostris extrusa TaxID=172846 RepID=A0AAV4MKY2_CAEEX|nr:hypothetical protein CEXT_104661 [Caerostris extrusa]